MTNHLPKNSPSSRPDAKPERNTQVVKLFLGGLSQSKIATMHGVSRERVRQILIHSMGAQAFYQVREDKEQEKRSIREANAEKRRMEAQKKRTALYPVRRNTKHIERALHAYSTYKAMRSQKPPATLEEIAKRLGMSQGSLWQLLYRKKHNMPMDFVRRTGSFNPEELMEMLKMHEGGTSIPQIGKRFQIRIWQVHKALKMGRALKAN